MQANDVRRPPFEKSSDPFNYNQSARIGDYPFPTNPMNDRAVGYIYRERPRALWQTMGII